MTCKEVKEKLGDSCPYFQNRGSIGSSECKLNEGGECKNLLAQHAAEAKKEK